MEDNRNNRFEDDDQNENIENLHFTKDNKGLKDDRQDLTPDGRLPEDDPALINPDELATFPKEVSNEDPDIESERDSHLTNRNSSPVRERRNITRTDTTPDNDGGFM